MTTIQTIFSIIGVVISLLTLLGIGVVMKNYWNDKHATKKANREEALEQARRERQEEIREVLREEIKLQLSSVHEELTFVKHELTSIKETVCLLKDSVIALDRIVMKVSLDLYKDRGYVSSSDRAAWNELFNNYCNLGGNHFKEYVNEWKHTLERIPTKDEKLASKA
jgi:hypothetical protein